MTVKAETLQSFVGVVHSRDFRKPECSGYGENTKVTYLRINMLAEKDDKDYCGVFTQVRPLLSYTCAKHSGSMLASHPAPPGLILGIPRIFLLMLLRFIDCTAWNIGYRLDNVNQT